MTGGPVQEGGGGGEAEEGGGRGDHVVRGPLTGLLGVEGVGVHTVPKPGEQPGARNTRIVLDYRQQDKCVVRDCEEPATAQSMGERGPFAHLPAFCAKHEKEFNIRADQLRERGGSSSGEGTRGWLEHSADTVRTAGEPSDPDSRAAGGPLGETSSMRKTAV